MMTQSSMRLEITSFANGGTIPGEFAFCIAAKEGHATFGQNRNPHLRWFDVPKATKSLAVIVHDPDVPSVPDDVNKEGRTVPHDLPRIDFYHWVLIDIPPTLVELPAGIDSDRVTAHGKELGKTDHGTRGRNDYTAWFSGDADMGGDYGGYDGPCPPWNDEKLHHYHFHLCALDVPSLGLRGNFGGADATEAMKKHILAEAEWVGTYTLNPDLG